MKTKVVMILAASILAAIVGCGGGTVVAGPTSPTPTTEASTLAPSPTDKSTVGSKILANPWDDPTGPKTIVYTRDLVSYPFPELPPKVDVTQDEAIDSAKNQDGFGEALQPGSPQAVLRMVSVGLPADAQAVVSKPSWVVIWSDSAAMLAGPAGQDPQLDPANEECEFIVIVDAITKVHLDARQLCRPRQ